MRIPPLIVLAGALVVSHAAAAVDPFARPASARTHLPGALLAVAGFAGALAGVVAFRRHRTTVDPRHPERASSLVTTGVYAWTRNPMYLGFALVALAGVVALASPLALAGPLLFVIYLDRVQIPAEERALHAHFGAAFETYVRRTGRWIGRRGTASA